MSFGVFVRLEAVSPATKVQEIIPWGDFPKPKADVIPGATKRNVTQRCHIIGWDLYARNYALRFLGRSIAEIATMLNYTGPQELSAMVSFIENTITQNYQKMNNDVTLYYNGKASDNTSAGARYRAAKEKSESIYAQWENWARATPTVPHDQKVNKLANDIRASQWDMFYYAFDAPPPNLFTIEQIHAYKIQYIQIYQDVVTGRDPTMYYKYFYGIDSADFVQKALQKLAT
jgi:hypothetical protein